MVNMTDGTDVYVGFISFKFFLSHYYTPNLLMLNFSLYFFKYFSFYTRRHLLIFSKFHMKHCSSLRNRPKICHITKHIT